MQESGSMAAPEEARGFTDSLWYRTADAAPPAGELAGTESADVAVIGGGITGLSAALHLAEAGARVAVVEATEFGAGASGRNGGFVVPHFARGEPLQIIERFGNLGERLVDLVGHSATALFELLDRHRIECDARQGGWFQPAHSASTLDLIEKRAAQWAARGQPVTLHDAAETEQLTGCQGYLGSWRHAGGGTVHPLKFVHGLARAAQEGGARVFARSPVVSLSQDGARWRLDTPRGTLQASQVLVCTNALSRGLLPRLALSVIPVDIYQAATEPLPQPARARLLEQGQCLSDTRINLFTYRFDAAWRLISGTFVVMKSGARQRLGARMAHRLREMLSLAETPRMEFIWCGRASIGHNFLPALYDLAPGVLAGTACNGRGIALSTELGRVMAQLAQGASRKECPVPIHRLGSSQWSPFARWGVRYYPLYGLLRDHLNRSPAGR